VVYSTREVQPEDFSEYRPDQGLSLSQPWNAVSATGISEPFPSAGLSRDHQSLIAWGLVLLGFFLMLAGL
jgi:hypothetical protein